MRTSPQIEPYISILIPTRNNANDLIDCLRSIEHLRYPLNRIDIIIWDNNSEPECKTIIKDLILQLRGKHFREIRFIQNNTNFGVYTSRDELLKLVRHDVEYVLSIDDDIILPSELLLELLSAADQDKSIGIVGPRVVFDEHPFQTAHGAGFINWWLGKYYAKDTEAALECDYIIGCCMLIKKSVIDKIDGFDRDYYTSHGEVDFCVKAKQHGLKTLYYPKVAVRHRVERGGTQSLERKYYVFRNKLFVIKKNAPSPQKWIALTLYFLFWPFKSILDSMKSNKHIDFQEIKIILTAVADGWLNKAGKKF